ncbi:MAG: insulinase family protein [Anaerolineaceae bacterium]|nr:insulinase family protein [Anaerolineaceae bacterium]
MKWKTNTLSNGLTNIAIPRPDTHTVAARLFFRAGSRYDPIPGCAHLMEHMLFQGTKSHSTREIFAGIEALGGEINAHTSREYLALHTVTLPQELPFALNLLANIVKNPAWPQSSFQKEKTIILQEILQASSRPTILGDTFNKLLFQDQALGHAIMGNPQSLQRIRINDITAMHQQRVCAKNAVLAICGDMDVKNMLAQAETAFSSLPSGENYPPIEDSLPFSNQHQHIEKDISQTHMMLGVAGVGLSDPARSALKLIELALGMGASGRLYRRLREELGLVYSIQTLNTNYEDCGYLAVRASFDPVGQETVKELILYEFDEICQNGLCAEELLRTKGNYAGTLARRFETNLATAGIFGIEALLNEIEPFEQAVQRIQAVTPEQIIEAANQILDRNKMITVSLGPSIE